MHASTFSTFIFTLLYTTILLHNILLIKFIVIIYLLLTVAEDIWSPPQICILAVLVVVEQKKFLSYPTMGGVILRLGTLPEPWESENTLEDSRRS